MKILKWDIYEITTESSSINGFMLRGRIRKSALENNINLLTENTSDIEKSVRFAILEKESPKVITEYLKTLFNDVKIKLVLESVENPVLSKLKVNIENRYSL